MRNLIRRERGVARLSWYACHSHGRSLRDQERGSEQEPTTVVYSTAGYEADAVDVAAKLGLPPTVVQAIAPPVKAVELRGANVIVVAGTDLTDRLK